MVKTKVGKWLNGGYSTLHTKHNLKKKTPSLAPSPGHPQEKKRKALSLHEATSY
jgi:hypothetical protein